MNYWVLSPNVTANYSEEPIWKDIILSKHFAFIGWGPDDLLGKIFIERIKIGDVLLIAQGANWQKKVFICGMVKTIAKNDPVEGSPKIVFYRELEDVVDKTTLESLSLNFEGCAFGESNQIPALYQLKPWQNENDKTLANKLYNIIQIKKMEKELQNKIAVLKFKKQIILQGPPGTGKTRLALEMARQLSLQNEIDQETILEYIKIGQSIKSSTGLAEYLVTDISNSKVFLQLNSGTIFQPSFQDIIDAYRDKIWNGNIGGGDTYRASIAKYIFENREIGEYCKLIQFHPAYSYEDFVRGITAKSNGTNIEYKTENKILASSAKLALENYEQSRMNPQELALTNWIETKLVLLKNNINSDIEVKGKYELTQKVYVYEVEDDCFRYRGDSWDNSARINLGDFKLLIKHNLNVTVTGEPEIPKTISLHASYRKSYYLQLIKHFFTISGLYTPSDAKIVNEQNYILIIDEINRANLPSVLGELIYGLEYRGSKFESMYDMDGDKSMIIPPNLYIIGTMNTADRSVGHIDYAIRRRFSFIDVLPSKLENPQDLNPLYHLCISPLILIAYDEFTIFIVV